MRLAVLLAVAATAAVPPLGTFRDTFTASGQEKTHAVRVSDTVKSLELRLVWKKAVNAFRVSDIRLQATSAFGRPSAAPEKLKITVVGRTAKSRTIRIEKLRPGLLRFTIVAFHVATPTAACLTRVQPLASA
jgi:hypothetical protein